MKNLIRELIKDLHNYYETETEYAKGYLDALYSLCKNLNIACERTEFNLFIEEDE